MTVQSAPAVPVEISPNDVERLLAENAAHDGAELAQALDRLASIADQLSETGKAAKLHGAQLVPAVYSVAANSIALLARHGRYQLRLHRIGESK